MIGPGLLVMGTPIVVGFCFGCKALAGVLIGALVSGVCGAVSASNTGGAWDNAKKYIEQGTGTDAHKAVVGDALKDAVFLHHSSKKRMYNVLFTSFFF